MVQHSRAYWTVGTIRRFAKPQLERHSQWRHNTAYSHCGNAAEYLLVAWTTVIGGTEAAMICYFSFFFYPTTFEDGSWMIKKTGNDGGAGFVCANPNSATNANKRHRK